MKIGWVVATEFDVRLIGIALAAGILAQSACARSAEPVKPQTLEQPYAYYPAGRW